MFVSATAFNNGGVALDWSDTSSVETMSNMFGSATAFNQDVSSWNVSSVTTMVLMFQGADAFNNDGVALDWSNTSSVLNMNRMFTGADAFNQVFLGRGLVLFIWVFPCGLWGGYRWLSLDKIEAGRDRVMRF